MISVIKTDSGGYNVVAIEDNAFILQGHLTKTQLNELVKTIKKTLKEEK